MLTAKAMKPAGFSAWKQGRGLIYLPKAVHPRGAGLHVQGRGCSPGASSAGATGGEDEEVPLFR